MAMSVESESPGGRPLKILLPISIDRFQSPITTLIREVASHLPQHRFCSFSNPGTDEDRNLAGDFWAQNHIERCGRSVILRKQFDLVWHASVTPSNILASRISRLRGMGKTRHLVTANVEMGPALRYAKLFGFAMRNAHSVVSVSSAVAAMVKRSYDVEVDAVIPNGFDPEYYSPGDGNLPAGVPEDFFLFCGALTERKRPDMLISLARALPQCSFVVVGGNPFPETGRLFISEMEALENVTYLGLRSRGDVRDLMRRARALVFPSEREGLPLSVIEALGCGCPVLAQPKSSLPELITDGENGWLLDDDVDAWSKRCKEIHESAPEGLIPVNQIRESVLSRFTWPIIAKSYAEHFQQLAG